MMDEVNDRKARKNNIVIYGAPEEASNNRTEEQEHDERFVQMKDLYRKYSTPVGRMTVQIK